MCVCVRVWCIGLYLEGAEGMVSLFIHVITGAIWVFFHLKVMMMSHGLYCICFWELVLLLGRVSPVIPKL